MTLSSSKRICFQKDIAWFVVFFGVHNKVVLLSGGNR